MTEPHPSEPWRRLGPGDAGILRAFLLPREDRAAGFSGQLIRDGDLRFSPFQNDGVFGVGSIGRLRGAVLWTRTGVVFPLFEDAPARDEGLERIFRVGPIFSFLGPEPDVEILESILGAEPRVRTRYRSMHLCQDSPRIPCPSPAVGASARTAGLRDTQALYALHSAYEREEVVTSVHRFDARVSRASLEVIMAAEVVAVAEIDGLPVATARTNARGFRTWQIGGVYVIPEFRGQGWGRFVMAYLIGVLDRAGKAASLFVKERNLTARGLYHSMGFRDVGPFRVDYL
ncbi:MAG TPA: GNAT family N-acetyltransferase [Magnetospirillaceae bacterium]|nr:GNAT family N-acetyltransferase [Magnetospirillaceae bacterium]